MKILVISKNGDSLGLCHRFKKEGHQVQIWIKEPVCRVSGEGMIDHASSVTAAIAEKPDVVLFDREGFGELSDKLTKAGVNVVANNSLADKMELDRKFGLDLMRKHGIKIPVTQEFSKIEDAMLHVKQFPKAYAIKMDGNLGASSSYVSQDAEDMLEYIEYQKERKLIKPGTRFVLQEVVKGVEISTEVWFSNGRPLLPYNGTLETKKFMPGDLGPNTGCETSAVFPYLSSSPKIIEKTLKKIFPLMAEKRWSGPLDINCIVSEKDFEPYGLEWTVRLGYSAIYALAAVMDDDLGEFFYRVASGKATRVPTKHSWGTSLRLSIPPYPLERPDKPEEEQSLFGDTEGLRIDYKESPNIWLLDAKKDKKGRIVVSGIDGTIAECTGSGRTLEEAWKTSQKGFDEFRVSNKQGRYLDGMESALKRAKKLRAMGYDVTAPDKETKNVYA